MFDYQSLSTRIGEQEFVVERHFSAPRTLMFQVFTQPEHLKRWWAPQPYTVPVCTIDLRLGGIWLNPVFGQSPEPVAQSLVYYASTPEVQAMTGLLLNKSRKPINSSPYTKDRAIQQRLWEASLALAPLEEVTPGERIHGGNK